MLSWEARLVLKKYKPRIVAITGSIGKSGTKDAVFAVLKEFYYVRKTDKSYNSEIGIPLTILGLPNAWNNKFIWFKNILKGLWLIITPNKYPEWLVLEVGVDRPKDMDHKAAIIKFSDVVVMTHVGDRPVHVEFFPTADDVIREKSKLIKTLKPSGTLVLSADDPKIAALREKAHQNVLTFGYDEKADIQASYAQMLYVETAQGGSQLRKPTGVSFRMNYQGKSMPVTLEGVFAKNYTYYALAALSVAEALKLSMVTASEALRSYEIQNGRLRLIDGVKDTIIIDDTYNSSPAASELALETLAQVETSGKKIAILGDMLELGKYTEEAHRAIGELAKKTVDVLVTVGPRSHFIAEGARAAKMNDKKIFHFDNSREAGKFVEEKIKAGDCILVKGSQGMRMERAVQEMMAHPEDKEKLLVRQEAEWLKR